MAPRRSTKRNRTSFTFTSARNGSFRSLHSCTECTEARLNTSHNNYLHKLAQQKILERRASIFRNDKGEDALGHGCHNITVIVRNNALEGGHGSFHLGLGDKAKDAQLCQSSIVYLGPEALLLLLLRHVLVAAKGIVQVKGTAGDKLGIEGGEFTNLAAFHVVLLRGNLAPLYLLRGEEEETKERTCQAIRVCLLNAIK